MHIGFVGLAGSGKSEVGKRWKALVEERRDEYVHVVDIARPLKNLAAEWTGVPVETVEADKGNFRSFLQESGRLVRHYKGEDWLITEAMRQGQVYTHAYIENVRMLNEYNKLQSKNWALVGLQCDEGIRLKRLTEKYGRLMTPEELTHETEMGVHLIFGQGLIVFENNTEEDADNIAELLFQWTEDAHRD